MTDEQIEKYIASKLKRNNRVLRINEKSIGDEGAKFLAESPLLEGVEKLIIYKGNIRDEGVQALADSKKLARLTALYLENNYITDRGARMIASSEIFKNLQILKYFRRGYHSSSPIGDIIVL
jgi:hypothetical protein